MTSDPGAVGVSLAEPPISLTEEDTVPGAPRGVFGARSIAVMLLTEIYSLARCAKRIRISGGESAGPMRKAVPQAR